MALSHLKWRMGMAGDTSESKQAFKMRIQGASDLLHQKSRQKDSIVVMTHGIVIHYLKKALLEKGWRVGKTSIRHWGVTQLEA
jgi:broad specificity phosphatase PhoE